MFFVYFTQQNVTKITRNQAHSLQCWEIGYEKTVEQKRRFFRLEDEITMEDQALYALNRSRVSTHDFINWEPNFF